MIDLPEDIIVKISLSGCYSIPHTLKQCSKRYAKLMMPVIEHISEDQEDVGLEPIFQVFKTCFYTNKGGSAYLEQEIGTVSKTYVIESLLKFLCEYSETIDFLRCFKPFRHRSPDILTALLGFSEACVYTPEYRASIYQEFWCNIRKISYFNEEMIKRTALDTIRVIDNFPTGSKAFVKALDLLTYEDLKGVVDGSTAYWVAERYVKYNFAENTPGTDRLLFACAMTGAYGKMDSIIRNRVRDRFFTPTRTRIILRKSHSNGGVYYRFFWSYVRNREEDEVKELLSCFNAKIVSDLIKTGISPSYRHVLKDFLNKYCDSMRINCESVLVVYGKHQKTLLCRLGRSSIKKAKELPWHLIEVDECKTYYSLRGKLIYEAERDREEGKRLLDKVLNDNALSSKIRDRLRRFTSQ